MNHQLKTLPIEVGKVSFWLVYRNLKPLASIVLDFDWGSDAKKQALLEKWFRQAKIFFTVSQKFPNTLHISKDKKNLDLYQTFELRDSFEAHVVRGRLYGFPEKAIQAYAEEIIKAEPLESQKLAFAPKNDELSKVYWWPYIEYFLRKGFELEDSLVAKKWADLARAEIPEIANQFEKETSEAMRKIRVETH